MPAGRPYVWPALTPDDLEQIAEAYARLGSVKAVSEELAIERNALIRAVRRAGYAWRTDHYLRRQSDGARLPVPTTAPKAVPDTTED